MNSIFGFGWTHPMPCANRTAHADASAPSGGGDDAGWRSLVAEMPRRAAAPLKLALSATLAKTRIVEAVHRGPRMIKEYRIVYAVFAVL